MLHGAPMARRRSWEALNARDLGRRSITGDPRPRIDITAELRALKATIVAPTLEKPYWRVYRGARFLGAGKTPSRAVAAATGRAYLDKYPSHGA